MPIADADARDKRAASGAVTLEQIELASAETDPTFFAVQREHLDQCIEEYGKLCATLAERCGDQAPPSSNLKNELEACSLALTFASKDVLLTATEDEALSDAEHSTSNKANGHAGSAGLSGQPSNREDAFKTLLQLAAYFRRTEPHSPLSYAIEQIVRWGRLPLPDLLEELIAEEGARTNMFRLAGIRRSGQSDSGKSE